MEEEGHPNKGHMLLSINVFFIVVSTVFVGLRLYARRLSGQKFWWDDWLTLVSWVIVTASNCTRWWFVKYGLGQHITDVAPEKIRQLLLVLWIDMHLYGFSITFIKLAAMSFFYRIFPSRNLHICLWITAGVVIATLIAIEFMVVFLCLPIHGFWDKDVESTCIPFTTYITSQAVPMIVADFTVVSLPVHAVWNLRITAIRKAWVSLIFVLGYFVTAVSITRAIIITRVNPTMHPDLSWNFVDPNLWSSIESSVGLVCICLPLMGIAVRQTMKRFGPKSGSGHSYPSPTVYSWRKNPKKFRSPLSQGLDTSLTNLQYDCTVAGTTTDTWREDPKDKEVANVPMNHIQVKRDYEVLHK